MKEIRSNKDFDESLLPYTRRKQFKEIFKNHWKKLALIGLIISLFALPLIMCNIVIPSASQTIAASLFEQGKTQDEINKILHFYTFIADMVAILGYGILSLGFAGGIRVIRNLVYDEGVLFKEDFLKGIKMYWRPFLITFLLYGIFRCSLMGMRIVDDTGSFAAMPVIIGICTAFLYVIIVPMMYIYLGLSVFYEDNILSKIFNSFKLYLSFFLTNLIFVPWLLALYLFVPAIPDGAFPIRILVELAIFIILAPLFLLIFHLYIVHVFDKAINNRLYPEIYRKGLSKDKKNNFVSKK